MKGGWSKLPPELLQAIFQYLKDDRRLYSSALWNLSQCELVCKGWKSPAQNVIYTSVKVRSPRCIEAVDLALSTNGSWLGKCVKSLKICNETEPTNLLEDWVDIETKFPNLKTIYTSEPNQVYYSRILQAHKKSQWPLLEAITEIYVDDGYLEDYTECLLAYRHNITRVTMFDKGTDDETTTLYNKLYTQLDKFPRLKHLRVVKQVNKTLDYLDPVVEKCRYLESVDLGLGVTDHFLIPAGRESWTVDLSRVAPRPNITVLSVNALLNRDQLLLYIMHKFPNLMSLIINRSKNDIFTSNPLISLLEPITAQDAATAISPNVLAKFLLFAAKMPVHYIDQMFAPIAAISDALFKFWTETAKEDAIVTAMTYNKADFTRRMDHIPRAIVNMGDKLIDMNFIASDGHNLPHMDIITRSGHLLSELTLTLGLKGELSSYFHDEDDLEDQGYYVDTTIQKCTQLKRLSLYDSNINFLDFDIVSSSIMRLDLRRVRIRSSLFSQISSKLPSLKELTLSYCVFVDQDGKDGQENISIDMGDASLEKLSVWHYEPKLSIKLSLQRDEEAAYAIDKYFSSTTTGFTSIPAEIFLNCEDRNEDFTYHIKCNSVDNFDAFSMPKK